MRPGIAARLERDHRDGDDRCKRDGGEYERGDGPAEIAALSQAGKLAAERNGL
jgi:hypothetical protein